MDFTKDPNDRHRVDPETQRRRDAEVARLRAAKVPFRTIAERLNMSLGAVQKALRRHQKLMDALSSGEPGKVLVAITDEMAIEDVRTPEDVARLNILECYRARHFPADHPARRAMVEAYAAGWREPEPYRPTGPINDGHSNSGSDIDDW